MPHTGRTIIRNASYMAFASTAQKVLSFFYFAAIARLLGAENTGIYFYALSVSQVLSVFLDGGFANYIVRETARDDRQGLRYAEDALGAKIILMGFVSAWIALFHFLGWLPIDTMLLTIAFFVVGMEALQVTLYSYLRGLQKIGYEAIAVVLAQILTVLGGIAVLATSRSVALLLLVLALASIFHLLYSVGLVHRFTLTWVRPRFDTTAVRSMLRECWPFALAAVFVKMIAYTDTVVLGLYYPKEIVGFYSVPYKLTYSFQFIPLALVATLYPAMSHLYKQKSPDLATVFMESVRLLVVASAAIGFGIASIASILVPLIYGNNFSPAIAATQVLPLVLVILFAQYPIGALLNSSNNQRFQTTAMGVGMVVNVIANFLFVPQWGMMGAVVASLIANTVFLLVSWYKAHQVIALPFGGILGLFARSIVAGAAMMVVVRSLLETMPLVVVILIGAMVFMLLSVAVGLITRADVERLVRAFAKHSTSAVV
ncbi:flippase [Candidatus Uhrbacteria bacterium]|nr:flippase [Candidatus Uhrbacteria bacterium]